MPGLDNIIGQELIVEHIKNCVRTGKPSHAYIIDGERLCGKEYVAGIFAQALLCTSEGVDPCCTCTSCRQAENRNHPDIIRLVPEKPNVISVDDIREQVNSTVVTRPYSGNYKIYIISEADKMNANAQNALLKTLEEPPEYVIIMLLTDNINVLIPTIQSRCVTLHMKPVSNKLVKKFLMDEVKVPDYRAEICAAFSRGNLGKAKILAQSEEFDKVKDVAINLLKHIDDMEMVDIMSTIKEMNAYKLEINDFLDILAIWYRDALLFKATTDANGLVFRDEFNSIKRTASRTSYEGIEEVLKSLDAAKSRLSANVSFDLTMELLLLTIKENC